MRKLLSTAVAIGIFTSTSLLPAAYADVLAGTLPKINQHDSNVDITQSGTNMNIKITGGQGAVGTAEWKSFDIASDSSVNVQFTNHHQTSFNKVMATGGLSEIYGKLTDNTNCNCTYNETGKIILVNPNGILFGSGARVDVNSFTASTLGNGTNYSSSTFEEYEKNISNPGAGTLALKSTNITGKGIKVQNDAEIHGRSNVTLASDNIQTYAGSKIYTNTTKNNATSVGQVKLYTTDGVNFTYSNWGGNVANNAKSTDKAMQITLNGKIDSGSIDVFNGSTAGDINIAGADAKLYVHKANKAVMDTDGNITLTANNNIIVDNNADIAIKDSSSNASIAGNITAKAGKNLSVKNSKISTYSGNSQFGDVSLESTNGNVVLLGSTVNSDKNINVKATNGIASIQTTTGDSTGTGSTLTASNGNINVTGGTTAQIQKSTLTAKDIVVKGGNIYTADAANVNASNNITYTADTGIASFKDTTNTATNKITISALNDSLKFNNTKNKAVEIDAKSKKTIAYNNTTSSNIIQGSDPTFDANDIALTSTEGNVLLNNSNPYAPFKTTRNSLALTASNGDVNVIKTGSGNLEIANLSVDAGKNIILKAADGNLTVNGNSTFVDGSNAELLSMEAPKGSVTTTSLLDTQGVKTQILAKNNINATLTNVKDPEKGLIATTDEGDINITAKDSSNIDNLGTLSVAKIISGKDLTINAKKIVKGKGFDLADNKDGYYPNPKLGGFDDDTDRGYIEVGANNDNDGVLTINNGTKQTIDYKEFLDTEGKTGDDGYIRSHHINFDKADDTSVAGKIYLVQKIKDNTGKADDPDLTDNTKGTEGLAANLGGDTAGETASETPGSSRGAVDITIPANQGDPSQGNNNDDEDCDDTRQGEIPAGN